MPIPTPNSVYTVVCRSVILLSSLLLGTSLSARDAKQNRGLAPTSAAAIELASTAAPYLSFNGGYAACPNHLPKSVHYVVRAGNELQEKPYAMGGGHRYLFDRAYDCSGSASYLLARAGLLNRPLSSAEFARYGAPGPGKYITIFVKPGEHVFMSICGLRFDTTGGRGREGPRWRPTPRSANGFQARHPWGL